MDSSKLFETGQKPADPNPVKPVAPVSPDDPNQPISVRTPHLTPRENEFNRSQTEPEVEPEIQPEVESEVLTIDEMLEMEDEELTSYGIDNPKTWKAYQRLLTKKTVEWKDKERIFEQRISDLERGKPSNPISPNPSPVNPEAPLVKPVKPQRPVRYSATEALTDPESESAMYMNAMDAYREAKDVYQDTVIDKLTGYVANDQQSKLQSRKRDHVKSQSLSRFQTRGLSAKDATKLYDQIEQAYMSDAETGADIFVNLFQSGNSNGNAVVKPKTNLGRRKLPENILMPPGVNTSTSKTV